MRKSIISYLNHLSGSGESGCGKGFVSCAEDLKPTVEEKFRDMRLFPDAFASLLSNVFVQRTPDFVPGADMLEAILPNYWTCRYYYKDNTP